MANFIKGVKSLQNHFKNNIDSLTAQKIDTNLWKVYSKLLYGDRKVINSDASIATYVGGYITGLRLGITSICTCTPDKHLTKSISVRVIKKGFF